MMCRLHDSKVLWTHRGINLQGLAIQFVAIDSCKQFPQFEF